MASAPVASRISRRISSPSLAPWGTQFLSLGVLLTAFSDLPSILNEYATPSRWNFIWYFSICAVSPLVKSEPSMVFTSVPNPASS